MNLGLITTFRLATWGIGTVLSAAWEFAKHPIDGAATLTDLRRLLKVFDRIPALEQPEVTPEFLDHTLALFQTGRLALRISYSDDDRTNVDVINMDHLTVETANLVTGGLDHFHSTVLSEGGNPHDPNISLLLNADNLARHPDKITADIIVEALMLPVRRLPVVGDVAARIIAWPTRKIADLLVGTIYTEAGRVASLLQRDSSPEEPETQQTEAAPVSLPSPEF